MVLWEEGVFGCVGELVEGVVEGDGWDGVVEEGYGGGGGGFFGEFVCFVYCGIVVYVVGVVGCVIWIVVYYLWCLWLLGLIGCVDFWDYYWGVYLVDWECEVEFFVEIEGVL